ncbi:MAG: hypothetical protein QOK15_3083 [Nocardioidaceae bacterium]|jgi:phosphomevalonate kinase|nr:hypothetical protein [Nocardioidaceae bacterium]
MQVYGQTTAIAYSRALRFQVDPQFSGVRDVQLPSKFDTHLGLEGIHYEQLWLVQAFGLPVVTHTSQ